LVVIKRRAHAVDLCRAEPNFSRYGRPTRRSIGCIAGNRARLVIIEAEHLGDLNKHVNAGLRRGVVDRGLEVVRPSYWDDPWSGQLEFAEPLSFTVARGGPPSVTVGVQVDVFAGGGGFIAGAGASISTFVPQMSIEWLFP
jgi:hypothetical protein